MLIKDIYSFLMKLNGYKPKQDGENYELVKRIRRSCRAALGDEQKPDLLTYKANDGWRTEARYDTAACFSLDNGKTWQEVFNDNSYPEGALFSRRRFRIYPIYLIDKYQQLKIWWYAKERYWIDEIIALRKAGKPIYDCHRKADYFRIGDNYYERKKFFEHEGKIYDKDEYILNNGKVFSKEQTVLCHFNVQDWGFRDLPTLDMDFALLNTDETTTFKENKPYREDVNEPKILQFTYSISNDNNNTSFDMPSKFISSMFRTNGVRYVTGTNRWCYLTKKDIEGLEFSPTKAHKEMVDLVQAKFDEMVRNCPDIDEAYKLRALMKMNFARWLKERIVIEAKFCDGANLPSGAGIVANIHKQLFTYRNGMHDRYSLDGFMDRIGILKEVFKKERENEERKLHSKRNA